MQPVRSAKLNTTVFLIAKKTGQPRELVEEVYLERCAIRESDGGFARPKAEQLAIGDAEDLLTRPAGQESLRGLSTKGAHFVPDGDQYW